MTAAASRDELIPIAHQLIEDRGEIHRRELSKILYTRAGNIPRLERLLMAMDNAGIRLIESDDGRLSVCHERYTPDWINSDGIRRGRDRRWKR